MTGRYGEARLAQPMGGPFVWRRVWGSLIAIFLCLHAACIPSSDSPAVPDDAANLSGLEITRSGNQPVALSPSFDSSVTNYTADVGGAVASVQFKISAVNPGNSTIRLQSPGGQTITVPSGQKSTAVDISPGANTFVAIVEGPGLTKSYTIVINRGANANLSSLVIVTGPTSQAGLTPAFDPAVTNYQATTGFSTASATVIATLSDETSRMTINGLTNSSGTPSPSLPLNVGQTNISIVVTAANQTSKTYTVAVIKAGTADLGQLTTTAGPLDPTFTPTTLDYKASTPFAMSQVMIAPTLADSSATITINGQPATSGQGFPVSLNVGPNIFTIVVTAQATPPSKTYTLTITRDEPSTNANLGALAVNPGILAPAFSPTTTGYSVTVGSEVTSLEVSPTVADPTASLHVNNQAASSGQAVTVGLNSPAPSTTVITVLVTAQNGGVQSYTVTVNRAAPASGNAKLGSLAVPPATINFNPSTTTYNASVANSTSAVTVQAAVADAGSTMTINGQQVSSPSNFNVNLAVGGNAIAIRVTAPAGNVQDYVVNISRGAAPSSDATLSNLVVTPPGGTVTGFTSPSAGPYVVSLPFGTSSATVTATRSNANASVFINGSQTTSRSVSLPTGPSSTLVTILVIAQNTSTNKTYTVNIQVAAPSSNANLSSLTLTPGGTCALIPNVPTQTCTVTVASTISSVEISATKADVTATMTGAVTAGPGTGSGSNPAFLLGGAGTSKEATITVQAQSGASQSYSITINRDPEPPPPPPPPTLVSLTPSPSINVGESTQLAVTISAAQAVDTSVSLVTDSPTVVTVPSSVTVPIGQISANVLIMGVGPGTAMITASLNGSSAQSTVTVTEVPPAGP